MKRLLFAMGMGALLAGCGAPQGKTGTVELLSPPDGAIIYSSALTVSGTAQGVNSGGFTVTVTDADGGVLTRVAAPERDSAFTYELIHGYSGQPVAAVITVTAADAPDDPPYATANITLAALEHRPEGVYVDILTPQPGDETGGDVIQIQGRASGIDGGTFTVELVSSDGTVVDSVAVTLPPGYIADDLPWTAALDPDESTGSAIVRVLAPDGSLFGNVPIVLSSAAG